MKNENESKEKIERVSSSTSAIIENIDLTLRATASLEPHVLTSKLTSKTDILQEDFASNANSTKNIQPSKVVKEILNSGVDTTGQQVQQPTTSGQQSRDTLRHVTTSQPNLGRSPREYHILRSVGGGLINSTSAMHHETFLKPPSKKSVTKIPPSYSSVLKLGPPITHFPSSTYSTSIPFIARQPPPSYAEVHGGWDENPSVVSSESFSLGPNPIYLSCPRCRTIVVSDTHTERSHLSYMASLVLCLCLCWPCCLLPYCLKACHNTYHFCPTCHYYLGVYRPC